MLLRGICGGRAAGSRLAPESGHANANVISFEASVAVERLKTYLKPLYPGDVLMPTPPGEKHPMFPHRDGQWGWAESDRYFAAIRQCPSFIKNTCAIGVAVVLRDLCVIDVDSVAQANALEARFPVLRTVPCEATQRGRHYWFERPEDADRLGYYDGAGQREPGIDFKSVCRSGTGGIVVIAPTAGRYWLCSRGLGCCAVGPTPMPLDLLDAVAKPHHPAGPTVDRLLLCFEGDPPGEPPLDASGRPLATMAYFEPFVSADAGEGLTASPDGAVPVPCPREAFQVMVEVLEHGELCVLPPGRDARAAARDAIRAADKLGVARARKLDRLLAVGLPRMQMEWADTDHAAWARAAHERAWIRPRPPGAADPDADAARRELVDVDAALARPRSWRRWRRPHPCPRS